MTKCAVGGIRPQRSGVATRDYIHNQGIPAVQPVAITRELLSPERSSHYTFRIIEITDQNAFDQYPSRTAVRVKCG